LAAVFLVLRFVFRLVFVRWLKWVKPPVPMDSWKETCRQAQAAADETLAQHRAAKSEGKSTSATPTQDSRRAQALRTLGIDRPEMDTAENIRGMYRALVKNHHPDAKGRGRTSTASFEEIHAAYKVLTEK
jgi:DnaJ-domain-containing protein 1